MPHSTDTLSLRLLSLHRHENDEKQQYVQDATTHAEVLPWHQGGYEDHHGDIEEGVVPRGGYAGAGAGEGEVNDDGDGDGDASVSSSRVSGIIGGRGVVNRGSGGGEGAEDAAAAEDEGDGEEEERAHRARSDGSRPNNASGKKRCVSGGSKAVAMWYNMFEQGFTGAFVMHRKKYAGEVKGSPVRVAKYMFQCIGPSPPRGCDTDAAKADPPRGRGWQRVGTVTKDWLDSLPPTDEIRARERWHTCAVVGNGGSLLLHKLGKRIDSADAVIRFNGGITKGFEEHVGKKTTVRLANTQHLGFYESEDELLLQHITIEKTMYAFKAWRAKHPKIKAHVIDGDFHQYVLDTMGDGAASNGFFGIVFAYERCDKVFLYGFAKGWNKSEDPSARVKYHYYDTVEPNESQQGRDNSEAPVMAKFVAKHRRVFNYGEMMSDDAM